MNGKMTVRFNVRFSDTDGEALEAYARERRLLPPDVIRMATVEFLRQAGALSAEPPRRKKRAHRT